MILRSGVAASSSVTDDSAEALTTLCPQSAVALISAAARPWVKVFIVEPSASPW
jgi:hypothetical protein